MTCSCLRCLNERGERPGTDPSLSPKPNSGEPASIRSQIERLLADGPKPYESILEAVGGDEDAIREAIRNWPGLTAYDSCGVWTWELSRDPVSIAERVALKFEAETPSDLGKPVLTYRGHVLAWESDPPHIKIYSWATVHLFPGRPLTVDVEPVARLLELSPREVRDALARLVKDGDLVRSWEGGREWYRLNIRYPEVRSDVPS